jgi:hypothetical protein
MSELHDAIQQRRDAFRPEHTPPFSRLRDRKRRRDQYRTAAALGMSVAAVVGLTASGALAALGHGHGRGDQSAAGVVAGGDAGLARAATSPLPPLRPLPAGALLQTTVTGGNGVGPQPDIPQIGLRLYADGRLLTPSGKTLATRWRQSHLTREQLRHLRALISDAGLAAGDRDYGIPTNAGFAGSGVVFQVNTQSGAAATAVEFGGTVNDVPSSDAALTQAQRDARRHIAELTGLLTTAAQSTTTVYVPTLWSRYAQASPRAASIDVAASPQWNGSIALNTGRQRADGLRCIDVADPAHDASRTYADGQYRVGSTAWEVRYDAVLPGEAPCTAVTTPTTPTRPGPAAMSPSAATGTSGSGQLVLRNDTSEAVIAYCLDCGDYGTPIGPNSQALVQNTRSLFVRFARMPSGRTTCVLFVSPTGSKPTPTPRFSPIAVLVSQAGKCSKQELPH